MSDSKSLDDAARELVAFHLEADPEVTEVFLAPDPEGAEIRLVEVTESMNTAGEILPLGHAPDEETPFRVVLVLLSPEDWQGCLDGRIELPEGWGRPGDLKKMAGTGAPAGTATAPRPKVDPSVLAAFCRKWKVSELALFGSVLRDDFRSDSDVDVLVDFEPGDGLDFFELLDMREELERLFGRKIDLVTKRSLRPRLRDAVLPTSRVLYAS